MNPNTVVEIPLPHGGVLEMGNEKPLTIIAGPCQLESREHGLEVSQALKEIADRTGVKLVYKTSFDKATAPACPARGGLACPPPWMCSTRFGRPPACRC